jgi:DNA-binding HxlR family transcriptional regulator
MTDLTNFFKIIQHKGTREILFQLRILPKRYNKLKTELENSISPRSLDFRLQELKSNNIIKQIDIPNSKPSSSEYILTPNGRILESLIFALSNLKIAEIPSLLFENLNYNLANLEKYNWDAIWTELQEICEEKRIIETLSSQQRKNVIENISAEGLTVSTDKGIRMISIELLRQAWEHLVTDGKLLLNEHDKSTYRSSFICALLSELDYVGINFKRPISIYLK